MVKQPHQKRLPVYFFCIIYAIFMLIVYLNRNANDGSIKSDKAFLPKLADGCYHVFLDVGANIGVHSRFVMEPNKYPDAKKALAHFEKAFGPPGNRDPRDFCLFAFEPNPFHQRRYEEFTKAYQRVGWRFMHIAAGVSDNNGELTFYHMDSEKHNEWGFSTLQSKCGGRRCIPEKVPVIRLSEWLDQHVTNRQLPSTVYGLYSNGPQVVMKMDVEFQEFVLLPDMVVSGAMCRSVESLFGEFHFRPSSFPLNFPQSNNITFTTVEEAREYIYNLIKATHSNPSCRTYVTIGDDESYLYDGQPWPEP